MASTYVNDLRIEEQATGENSGTWGTKVNSAFSQIAEAFSYGTKQLAADSNETFTMPDGTSDGTRSLYLKITSAGSLTATRTVTLGPNTVSKLWIIENATTGSQSITIAQGSGGTVTIPTGAVKMVYSDGAGSGAAVVDALTDVYLASVDHAAFGDNKKAVFGAGSDLQIYHDGSNSFIQDVGTGDLIVRASNNLYLQSYSGAENYLTAVTNGAVTAYYDNSAKLATTSTGIDVTGTVTADGVNTDYTNGFKIYDGSQLEASWTHANATGTSTLNVGRNATWGGELIIQTDTKNRANFASNGDISFYEDTGTTAKFFWDASAENLTITGQGNQLRLARSSVDTVQFGTGTVSPITGLFIQNATDSNIMMKIDDSAPTDSFVLNSSGNVGIGTDSPAANSLTIEKSGTARLRLTESGVRAWDMEATGGDFRINNASGSVEAMRIDSSGNLLVGKTALAIGTAGIEARASGQLLATADGDNPVDFNRKTSDGNIALFRKDGTTVGSIGSASGGTGVLTIDSGATSKITLDGIIDVISSSWSANEQLSPTTSGVDLGNATTSWEDLYLSGGVYLGGTGAANYLDDYEEGDYDATITTGTSGTVTLNGSFNRLSYTKVGRSVHVSGFLVVSSVSSPVGYFKINLPFTPANLTDRAGDSAVALVIQAVSSANIADFVGSINEADANLYVQLGDSNTIQNDSAEQLQANTYITISATYNAA